MSRRSLAAAALALLLAPCALAQTPRKYALLIGLNNYLKGGSVRGIPPLAYARADVEALQTVLAERGYEVLQRPLIEDRATREDIIEYLAWYANNLTEADTFILYFAGHGVRRNPGSRPSTFWLTWKSALDALDVEGVRLSHLMDYVEDIPAGQKLILLDHCFSGDVVPEPTPTPAPAAAAASATAGAGGDRGGTRTSTTLVLDRNARPLEKRTLRDYVPRGTALLAASRGSAFEVPAFGHGLFTYVLLKALTTREADTDKNGVLSLSELQVYLANQVLLESQKLGQEQTVTDVTEGVNTSRWIVANLPADSTSIRRDADRYEMKVAEWTQRELLKVEIRRLCFKSLEAWIPSVTSGAPLSDVDRRIVAAVRSAVDSPGPEDARANELRIEVMVASGLQP